MEGFARLHKVKPAKFSDLNKKRVDASAQLQRRRKDIRAEQFNVRRNIPDEVNVKHQGNDRGIDKSLERKLALKKYRSEKNVMKNKEKENKKPPFVVGIPHHGSSPLLRNISSDEACNHANIKEEVRSKRVTRAMSKLPHLENVRQRKLVKEKQTKNIHLLEKNKPSAFSKSVKTFPLNNLVQFHPPRVLSIKKLTSPRTPTVLKRSVQKSKEASKPSNETRCHINTRKTNIQKDKEFSRTSEECLATPLASLENGQENLKSDDTGNCVAVIKEESLLSNTIVKDQNPNQAESYPDVNEQASSEEENSAKIASNSISSLEEIPDIVGAECQRNRLEQETSRLLGLAQVWEEITQTSNDLPPDTVDEVDSVVGQTRLLINDKFNQFRKLIGEYETKSGSHIITSEDLDGFWDMMYLQVTNLTKRYEELEKIKNNKWIKASPPMKKKRGRPSKSKLKIEATSSFKNFIKGKRIESFAEPIGEVYTPSRKSIRLLEKTPLIKQGHCIVCQSPLNTNHCCLTASKSKTKSSSKSHNKAAEQPADSPYPSDFKPEKKSSKSTKKFSLRPSILVVKNITNSFEESKTPPRRSERKRTCFLPEFNGGKFGAGLESVGGKNHESEDQ